MAWPYDVSKKPQTGDTITAADLNTSNQEHISSNIPEDIDDYSVNSAEMLTIKDPKLGGTIVLATTLAEELEGKRFAIKDVKGEDDWIDPASYTLVELGAMKRNAIINGDLNIWLNNVSFSSVADDTYTAEMWKYNKTGTMVHTITRVTDVPTLAQSGHLSKYAIKVDCTTVDAAIAAGDICQLSTMIEGYNYAPLAQQPMVLSFWHKHTKTGTYCVALKNSGDDRSYTAEYTQTSSDTWELATILISASPSAGTWDYTNGVGLQVLFTLASGSTFHGTVDTWNTGDARATSSQVNACDNTGNDFIISQVSLRAGRVLSTASVVYEGVDFATELAQCLRYFETSYDIGTYLGSIAVTLGAIGFSANGASHVQPVQFKVPKRTIGSVVLYNPNSGATGSWRDYTAGSDIVVAADDIGFNGMRVDLTSSNDRGLTSGHYAVNARL